MAFPGDYTKYQEVTIQSSEVDANLTDFPVYVDLNDLDKAGADIFDTCRTDGGDIRVTKSDGTTELAREIVAIDTTAKTGQMHFKFTGTLSSSSNTTVRVWYNGTDTEPAASATYGSQNVWSDYETVYHADDASGGLDDSTSNANDATEVNTPVYSATGKIGSGVETVRSSSEGFNMPAGMGTIYSDFTFQAWMKTGNTTDQLDILRQDGTGSQLGALQYNRTSTDVIRTFWRDIDGNVLDANIASTTVDWNNDSYHMHHVLFDGPNNTFDVYLDGASQTTSYTTQNTSDNHGTSSVTNQLSRSAGAWDGEIDEIRFRSGSLASGWITTEYSNQNAPGSFYTTGDEVDTSGGVVYNGSLITFGGF